MRAAIEPSESPVISRYDRVRSEHLIYWIGHVAHFSTRSPSGFAAMFMLIEESHVGLIEIKRVYEPRSRGDGKRILVDRLWPRGLRKTDAAIDLWKKDIAPTPTLRTWFGHRADRFSVFKRRYREELKSNPAVTGILEAIGDRKATLLYAARNVDLNHAVVLADFLRNSAAKSRRHRAERERPRDDA